MSSLNLKTNDNFSTYWDQFYQGKSVGITPTSPSQFAAFCLSEMVERDISFVHEIGCGNGRDTLFFLRYGISVSAVDSSLSAIHATKLLCGGSKNFAYHKSDAIKYLNKIERHQNFGPRLRCSLNKLRQCPMTSGTPRRRRGFGHIDKRPIEYLAPVIRPMLWCVVVPSTTSTSDLPTQRAPT